MKLEMDKDDWDYLTCIVGLVCITLFLFFAVHSCRKYNTENKVVMLPELSK